MHLHFKTRELLKTIVYSLKNKRNKCGLLSGNRFFYFHKKYNCLTFTPRFIAQGIFGKFSCCTLNRNEEHMLMLAQRENDDLVRQNQHLMNDNAVKDKRYAFIYGNLQVHIVLLRKIIETLHVKVLRISGKFQR